MLMLHIFKRICQNDQTNFARTCQRKKGATVNDSKVHVHLNICLLVTQTEDCGGEQY